MHHHTNTYLKLTIETLEKGLKYEANSKYTTTMLVTRSGVFIVKSENISPLFLVFLFLL